MTLPASTKILKKQEVGIDFFRFESITDSDEYYQFLSKQEQARAAELKFPDVYQQYVLTRGMLRFRLAEQLDCQPTDLIIETHAKGKPYLKNVDYQFNVSHTRGAAVIAISPDIQLGIDIEDVTRDVDIVGVAKHIFTQQEQDFILNHRDKTEAFFLCWTRKEAFTKAHGSGIYSSQISPAGVPLVGTHDSKAPTRGDPTLRAKNFTSSSVMDVYSDFDMVSVLDNKRSKIEIVDDEQRKWFIQDWKTIDQYRIALATNKIINQIVCLRML